MRAGTAGRLTALLMVVPLLLAPLAAGQSPGDPSPGAPEWIEAEYLLTVSDDFTSLDLDGDVLLHEVNPSEDFARVCPTPCTADDLRELYQNPPFGTSQETIARTIEQAVAERALQALQAVAGDSGEAEVTARVDRSSLSETPQGDGFQPPVPVTVSGTAILGLLVGSGYSQDQVEALFEMGARFRAPVSEVVDAGNNLTLSVAVPDPLGFPDPGQASLGEWQDGPVATWSVTNWEGDQAVTLEDSVLIGREDVGVPESEEGEVDIVLDLSRIDIHYAKLFGPGPAASMTLAVDLDATFASIENPQGDLGDKLILPFLSADAIRIAIDEGLIDRRELTGFQEEARAGIRGLLAGFGTTPAVEGGLNNETLDRSANGQPVGTGPPIRMVMGAQAELPLPPEEGAGPAGSSNGQMEAFTITTVDIGDLTLPRVPIPGGQDVRSTLTFILPPGVDLRFQDVQGAEVQRGATEDGRTMITLTSTSGGEGQATLQGSEMALEHTLIGHLFWPVLLFLFLLLVVLPGAIIGWVIYRRREKSRRLHDQVRGAKTGEGGNGNGTGEGGGNGRGRTGVSDRSLD